MGMVDGLAGCRLVDAPVGRWTGGVRENYAEGVLVPGAFAQLPGIPDSRDVTYEEVE